jgi:hypothetical protein
MFAFLDWFAPGWAKRVNRAVYAISIDCRQCGGQLSMEVAFVQEYLEGSLGAVLDHQGSGVFRIKWDLIWYAVNGADGHGCGYGHAT